MTVGIENSYVRFIQLLGTNWHEFAGSRWRMTFNIGPWDLDQSKSKRNVTYFIFYFISVCNMTKIERQTSEVKLHEQKVNWIFAGNIIQTRKSEVLSDLEGNKEQGCRLLPLDGVNN